MKLYDIVNDLQDFVTANEGLEDEQAYKDTLEALQGELNDKVSQWGRCIRNLEAERDAIDLPSVARLFASPLGTEMRSASDLRREFRFLLLCDAGDYAAEAAPDDRIMLQGVVDCFFIRDGAITIVDYKTDHVSFAEVPARAETYRGQMLAYAGALKRIFGLPVRRCVLWFLHPGAEYEIALKSQEKIL